jgi:hypothetical protein
MTAILKGDFNAAERPKSGRAAEAAATAPTDKRKLRREEPSMSLLSLAGAALRPA